MNCLTQVILLVVVVVAVYGQAGNGGQKDESRLYELGLDLLRYQLRDDRKDEPIGGNASQVTSGETSTQFGIPNGRDQRGTFQLSGGTHQPLRPTPFEFPQQSNRQAVPHSPSSIPGQTHNRELYNFPANFERSGSRANNFETERPKQSGEVYKTNYYGQTDKNQYPKQPSNLEQTGIPRQSSINGRLGSSVGEFERGGQGRYTNGPGEIDYKERASKLQGKGYQRTPYELVRAILEDDRYSPERRSKYNSKQYEVNNQNYDEYNAQRSRTSGDQYGTYSEDTRGTRPSEREREEYQRLRRKLENLGRADQEFQRENPGRVVYQSNPQHVVVPVINTQRNILNHPTYPKERQNIPERSYLSNYQKDILSRFSTLPPQLLSLISAIPQPPRSSDKFDYGRTVPNQNGSRQSVELYKIPNGYGSIIRKRNPDGGSVVDASQVQSAQGVGASSAQFPPK
ncbi:uncharacterized protein [Periplaneta americana]|uniref:uncharacterized protein isoform X2 n=1 Tax=Periplaneta americana TaxID=6978 RepID=UPI0037E92B7B